MLKNKQEFNQELIKRFPYNHIQILEYSKASGPIVYKCLDCGKIYNKSKANHLYENITLCQSCYTGKDGFAWKNFRQNAEQSELTILQTANLPSLARKITVQCNKCNKKYLIKWSNHAYDTKIIQCRYCGTSGAKIQEQRFINMAKESHKMEEYNILQYNSISKSVKFQHNCGYIFSQNGNNFLRGRGCPKCYGNISKGQQKIQSILIDKNIKYISQYKLMQYSKHLSYDFYLPEYKTLIQYQGEQHYRPLEYLGGKQHFQQQIKNDKTKEQNAKLAGLKLIIIPYTDFQKIPKYIESSTTISQESRLKRVEAESIRNNDDIV